MKKILWLVILLPLGMLHVFASDVYYSDYGEFSAYTDESIPIDELTDVESVMLYKWYKWVKDIGDYKLYNTQDSFTDDCYETPYSEYSFEKPNIQEATILDEKTVYEYQMIQPIRYIHLYDLYGSYDAFRIPELEVYVDGNRINYTYSCNGCHSDFERYINNGVYVENGSYIKNGGNITIDLGKEYPINKIKVVIYIFDVGSEVKRYTLGYSKDGHILYSKSYSDNFSLEYYRDAKRYEYMMHEIGGEWLTSYEDENYINNAYVYSIIEHKKYRFKEKLCRTYTMYKEYYPSYSASSVADYVIYDDMKLQYRYRKRDKIELDLHDIVEYNYDLNNFVVMSTKPYTITSNIDWLNNGTYDINFKTDNIDITKKVNVIIVDNSLQDMNASIEGLKKEVQSLVANYNYVVSTTNKMRDTCLEQIDSLTNELLELKKDKDITSDKLDAYITKYGEVINQLNLISQDSMYRYSLIMDAIDEMNNRIGMDVDDIRIDLSILKESAGVSIKELYSLHDNAMYRINGLSNEVKTIANVMNTNTEYTNERFQSLSGKMDEYTIKILEMNAKIDRLYNENERHLKEIYGLNDIISNITDNYNGMIKNINDNRNEYMHKIDDLNNYINELHDVDEETVLKISEMYEDLITKISNLNEETNDSITLIFDVISLFSEDKVDIGSYEDEINKLYAYNDDMKVKIDDLNLSMQTIFTDLQNDTRYEDIIEKLYDKDLMIDKIQQDLVSLEEEYHKTIDDIKQVDYEMSSKSDLLEAKITDFYKMQDEIENLREDVDTMDNYLKEVISSKPRLDGFLLRINNVVINLLWSYILVGSLVILIIIKLILKKKKNSSFVEHV